MACNAEARETRPRWGDLKNGIRPRVVLLSGNIFAQSSHKRLLDLANSLESTTFPSITFFRQNFLRQSHPLTSVATILRECL
jgi:hypothetical protein